MTGTFLDLFIQGGDNRKKIVYLILQGFFSLIITSILFQIFFYDFYIIPLTDYNRIFKSLIEGNVVAGIVLLIVVWKLFFTWSDILIYNYLSKLAYRFYDFFIKRNEADKFLDAMADPKDKFMKLVSKWTINSLLYRGFINMHGNAIVAGKSIDSLIEYFENLKNGKEKIDLDLAYIPIPLLFQFMVIYFLILIDKFQFSNLTSIFIVFIFIISIIISCLAYFINILIKTRQLEILNFLIYFKSESEKKVTSSTAK